MKEKIFLIIGAVTCFVVLIGMGGYMVSAVLDAPTTYETSTVTNTEAISVEEAKSIALTRVPGKLEDLELGSYNGRNVITVEIENGDVQSNVHVDALTGDVLGVDREEDVDRVVGLITEAQAKSIALGAVSGTVKEVEGKKLNGIYYWEVEVATAGKQADVWVNANTGAVYNVEFDEDDDEFDEEDAEEDIRQALNPAPRTSGISEQEAIDIALSRVNGRQTDIERESHKGHDTYAVEIQDGGDEVDVFVDVQTGEVIDIERD